MAAYVIVDIEVTDPARYQEYMRLAPATLERYGGRYLARGGATEILEGSWAPHRLVILEFESVAQAKVWVNSAEYRPARVVRQQSARSDMVVVEGAA